MEESKRNEFTRGGGGGEYSVEMLGRGEGWYIHGNRFIKGGLFYKFAP